MFATGACTPEARSRAIPAPSTIAACRAGASSDSAPLGAFSPTRTMLKFGGSGSARFAAARRAVRRTFNAAPAALRMSAAPGAGAVESQAAEQAAAASGAGFDWRKQWYPVTFEKDFPVGEPYKFSLFDEPLVLWRAAASDEVRCVEDRCPHRAVPLSEGRVVPPAEGACGAGTLECGYHGWQFDGAGRCTRIPQLPADVPINERRSCIKAYPVVIRQGIVWLWADHASVGPEEAIPLSPTIARPDMDHVDVVRDLPYDYNVLVENIIDPSHVPFSHHAVQGNRYRAGPIKFVYDESVESGFKADMVVTGSILSKNSLRFIPPAYGEYQFGLPMGEGGLVTYFVPTGHGRCRALARFPRNFALWFMHLRPRWCDHVFERMLILDQDLIFLREQEKRLRREGYSWTKEMYLPAEADSAVIRFRKWMDQTWGSMPNQTRGEDPARPLPAMREEELLDRYSQHVKICSACSKALARIRKARSLLKAAAAALVAFAALVGRVGPVPPAPAAWALAAAVAAAVCASLTYPLRAAEQRFFYFPSGLNRRPATRKELALIRGKKAPAEKHGMKKHEV